MKPNRNDPCPCGSGKKYKQCCLKKERAAHPLLRLLGGSAASAGIELPGGGRSSSGVWEVDFVPISTGVKDDPTALPTALLVVEGVVPLFTDLLACPLGETDAVAGAIERAVLEAAKAAGSLPREVRVRHPEIRDVLADALAAREVAVLASPLPALSALAG